MKTSCNCGAVEVEVSIKPEYVNLCDCSLCRRSGGAWGYFSGNQVRVSGKTRGYRRADYEEPAVELRFCAQCGTTTHWTLTEHFEGDRTGVNMRLFDPAELNGIEARTPDGRNWSGDSDVDYRRPHGKLGEDVFL